MSSLEIGELKVVFDPRFVRLAEASAPAEGAVPFDAGRNDALSLENVEAARQARLLRAAASREDEKPVPDPWDAWRTQRAPEMFEPEVTNRG